MSIRLQQGDLFSTNAAAVILTIDGRARGLHGAICRQFERRCPEDWESIECALRFPIPLGHAIAVPRGGAGPFELILVASTLHHLEIMEDQEKVGVVRSAFGQCIRLAARHKVRSLATAVMTGGWRLPSYAALRVMGSVARSLRELASLLEITILVPADVDLVAAKKIGHEDGWHAVAN